MKGIKMLNQRNHPIPIYHYSLPFTYLKPKVVGRQISLQKNSSHIKRTPPFMNQFSPHKNFDFRRICLPPSFFFWSELDEM